MQNLSQPIITHVLMVRHKSEPTSSDVLQTKFLDDNDSLSKFRVQTHLLWVKKGAPHIALKLKWQKLITFLLLIFLISYIKPRSICVSVLPWPNFWTDFETKILDKFSALKDLNPFKTVSKVQEAGSILKVGFDHLK